MNRNVESHFSMLPSAEISRSRFDRSFDHKTTFNVGELIPFFVDLTVMPGDTFDITTSKVVRLQTLLTPVMDNIYLDTYWFFVPFRLLHTHWREIMGENRASAWLPEVQYTVPQIKASYALGGTYYTTANKKNYVDSGSIFDYMGIPISDTTDLGENTYHDFSFSAYAWRAYCMIFNEWFRDENLTDPVNWSDGDADLTVTQIRAAGLDKPLKVAKYHDYFTSSIPSAQKGPAVTVPGNFDPSLMKIGWPVVPPDTTQPDYESVGTGSYRPLKWRATSGQVLENQSTGLIEVKDTGGNNRIAPGLVASAGIYPSNLFARPSSNVATGLNILVNDLRYAFQLQKLYERDARGGTRYIELIKSHFSVESPDARMQRPEYLGGNRIPISIHQITNQSQGENDFLGDLGAMSLTTDKHNDFVKSFTEHGVLLGLMCARYDHSYPQGLNRMWSKKSRFDFYWPVFANLGEQATLRKEIYLENPSASEPEQQNKYYYLPSAL